MVVFCEFVRLKLSMTRIVTYGPWPAIATLLRASKAQRNLRNIVKKGTKKFNQVKEENKHITYFIYF